MKFRVEVICVNDEGAEQRRNVMEMERQKLAMETLGLSLAEGKTLLRGVQDFVASQQAAEYLERRRNCPSCGQRYHSKEAGTSTVETVFGAVAVPNPRWERCPCQTQGAKTFRPTATWLKGRTSPERLYLETKWGSLIPYEKVAALLKDVLPVSESTHHEMVREHLHAVAERMEAELGEERQPDPVKPEADPPKSARKNRSGDVDAIFCASRGGRVVGGRYYLRPGAAGYAERGFGRCVKGRGYCLAAAREETWRPSEEDLRKLTGG